MTDCVAKVGSDKIHCRSAMAIGFRIENDPALERASLEELAARAPANRDTVRGAQVLFSDFYYQEFQLQGVSIAEEEERRR